MSNNHDKIELTNFQKQVIIGTLLGDSTIRYVNPGTKNPNLTFSHSEKQIEYGHYKFDILKDIMSSWTDQDRMTNYGQFKRRMFTGKNCKVLKRFREAFYPKGIKVLNIPYLLKVFTEVSLCFLFMDDGCKSGNTIHLNLQNFELSELEDFVHLLKWKFDLDFTIKKDKTLYLRQKSFDKFVDLIKPWLHPTMYYKITASCLKTPLNGETPKNGQSRAKLSANTLINA